MNVKVRKSLRRAVLAAEAMISVGGPSVLLFAETETIEKLNEERLDLFQRMETIQAKADGEKRKLDAQESQAIDDLGEQFDAIEAEIERRKGIADRSARLSKPSGRKTAPNDSPNNGGTMNRRIDVNAAWINDKEKWGWNTFGEYARAVKAACNRGVMDIDPRLRFGASGGGPDVTGASSPGEDGGFAIPPDFRREIMVKVAGEDSLVARTDQYTTDSNGISFPSDETTPWGSQGIQANWTGEGQRKEQSKPVLKLFEVKLHKLTALVPMTDELLEDAPAMASYLRRKTPQVLAFKINDAIINGVGDSSLMPFGILESDATITVDPEGSSAGNPLTYTDVVNMYSRMYAPCRRNAVWLINQGLEPAMMMLAFPGAGTAVPAYMPPGGLSATPFATLMGRPVLPIESANEVGSPGDIIFADLTQYVTAQKTSGIRQDVSIHLWFDYDITAFRFVLRIGGKPWWTAPVTGNPGADTSAGGIQRSCFVILGQRS